MTTLMNSSLTEELITRRELAHRVEGGVEVTLYWSSLDDTTSIEVFHAATETTLHFEIPGDRALDAFYHPFAHLPAPKNDWCLL